ncbi:MAG: HD domain-containing protein [Spirochaetaceae bacterium]|nr:MAG: HD domain-containing protein [Spirochaetaceae bacterium]
MRKSKSFYLLFLIICILLVAPAAIMARDAVIQRAIDAAETELITREFDRAYSRIRIILRYYQEREIDDDARSIAERVVSAYTSELAEADDWQRLKEIEQELAGAPSSVIAQGAEYFDAARQKIAEAQAMEQIREEQEAILEQEMARLAELERQQKEGLERQRQLELQREQERQEYERQQELLRQEREKLDAEQRERIDRMMELNRSLEEERELTRRQETEQFYQRQVELENARAEQEKRFREQLELAMQSSMQSTEEILSTTTSFGYKMMIGLAVAGVIVIILVVIFVLMTVRQQRIQQQQFTSTIKTFQAMQMAQSDTLRAVLPFTPDGGGPAALPGNSNAALLTDQSGGAAGASDAEAMRRLVEQCRSYASEIDKITNRKNAAATVAELTYKISMAMGHEQPQAVLHYAAGLVYDIGFLNIDQALLQSKTITEDQFAILKTHTTIGMNMVFFVPEEYRDLFKDAVSKHHENIDGSGYPYGLKGNAIPYIARVIRVAESYVALVSRRDYRNIMDRDAAFEELYSHTNFYDKEIVTALDELV